MVPLTHGLTSYPRGNVRPDQEAPMALVSRLGKRPTRATSCILSKLDDATSVVF